MRRTCFVLIFFAGACAPAEDGSFDEPAVGSAAEAVMTAPPLPRPNPRGHASVGPDFNGDGRADLVSVSPDAAGGWAQWMAADVSTGAGFGETAWNTSTPQDMRNGSTMIGHPATYIWKLGDFNGDGKTDIATISDDGGGGWASWFKVDLSTGSGFNPGYWGAYTPQGVRAGGPGSYRHLVGDFNGDGKSDLATLSPDGGGGWAQVIGVELSTGSGFASGLWPAMTPVHMRNGGSTLTYVHLVGDFDGDGKSDIATFSQDGGGGWASWAALELSTGTGFTSTVWPTGAAPAMRAGDRDAAQLSHYGFLVGDFNGDGKSDVAVISQDAAGEWSSGVVMNLSTGAGFTTEWWPTPTPAYMRGGGSGSSYRYLVGDFNGDGKTDIVTVSPNAGGGWTQWVSVDLSTGSGFSESVWPTATAQLMHGDPTRSYEHIVGDFNGDGISDIATVSPDAGGGWSTWFSMDITNPSGAGFNQATWPTPTAQSMRDGGAAYYHTMLRQGTMVNPMAAPPYRPTGAIAAYWLANGGANGPAGWPVGPLQAIAGGLMQPFSGGTVYSSAYGTALVKPGPINDAWQSHTTTWGAPSAGPAGELGFPVEDEVALPDGGRYQRFWHGGLKAPIALAPGATTAFAVGNSFWLDRGGPDARTTGSGLDQATGWPVEPVKNYGPSSPYFWEEDVMGCRSLRASRMYRQVFQNALGQKNTWCFFQDSAPQNEFMPDFRDCHKSALNKTEWKNPGQSLDDTCRAPGLDPVLNPPNYPPTWYPPTPPAGCDRGAACLGGDTFMTDESYGQRFCGCYGDYDLSTASYATTSQTDATGGGALPVRVDDETAPPWESPYLVGLHGDNVSQPFPAYSMMNRGGKPIGWMVFTEKVGHSGSAMATRDYSAFGNRGIIVRINHGYNTDPAGQNGTISLQADLAGFAASAGALAAASPLAHIWIVGNEMNMEREWPKSAQGVVEPITPDHYANAFRAVRAAIHGAGADHAQDLVLLGGIAPACDDICIKPNGATCNSFLDYYAQLLAKLPPGAGGTRTIDGIAMHAYTHGVQAKPDGTANFDSLVSSEEMMGSHSGIHYQFRVYRDFLATNPDWARLLPVYITETDQEICTTTGDLAKCGDGTQAGDHNVGWSDHPGSVWVQNVYNEIDAWNQGIGHQKIHAVVLYRADSPVPPSTDPDYGIQTKANILNDFSTAIGKYQKWTTWSMGKSAPGAGDTCGYYKETGYHICNVLLKYWDDNNGVHNFGYPREEGHWQPDANGNVFFAQYFERNRLEYHPENTGPYTIEGGAFGLELYRASLTGTDTGIRQDNAVATAAGSINASAGSQCNKYPTNFSVCDFAPDGTQTNFASDWSSNFLPNFPSPYAGSLALFGFPITAPYSATYTTPDGRTFPITVQWFERARMEWHGSQSDPNKGFQLGLLGDYHH